MVKCICFKTFIIPLQLVSLPANNRESCLGITTYYYNIEINYEVATYIVVPCLLGTTTYFCLKPASGPTSAEVELPAICYPATAKVVLQS